MSARRNSGVYPRVHTALTGLLWLETRPVPDNRSSWCPNDDLLEICRVALGFTRHDQGFYPKKFLTLCGVLLAIPKTRSSRSNTRLSRFSQLPRAEKRLEDQMSKTSPVSSCTSQTDTNTNTNTKTLPLWRFESGISRTVRGLSNAVVKVASVVAAVCR